jgi:hypothetical protein
MIEAYPMDAHRAHASFKQSKSKILVALAAGAIFSGFSPQAAESEGPRWDFKPTQCSWGQEHHYVPVLGPCFVDFNERFEKLFKDNNELRGQNYVGCTFLLESDGRIANIQAINVVKTPDLTAQASLINFIRKTAPLHIPDATTPHGLKITLVVHKYPKHYLLRSTDIQ